MGEFLYNFFILPIEYLMDAVVYKLFKVYMDPALVLIGLSLVVSVVTLPLYRRAELLQNEERAKQKKMEGWIKHIKKTFRSDERSMILWRYYRLEGYNPVRGLKTLFPLLLQIPFFIAAYQYLSSCRLFSAVSAFGVRDLAYPDGLLVIGGVNINLLPFIMTGVNLLSGAIWTEKGRIGDRVQQLLIALVFLALLYNSPAVLLLYWTFNNVFSLCKNIFSKYIKNKTFMVTTLFCLLPLHYIFVYLIALGDESWWYNNNLFFLFLLSLPVLYVCLHFMKKGTGDKRPEGSGTGYGKDIIAALLALTLFLGGAIPAMVIASSPNDFIDPYFHMKPFVYVLHSLTVYAGGFIFWGIMLLLLIRKEDRKKYASVLVSVALIAIFNVVAYGKGYGSLDSSLQYAGTPGHGWLSILLNIAVSLAVVIAVRFLYERFRKGIVGFMCLMAAVCLIMVFWGRIRVEGIMNTDSSGAVTENWESLKGTAQLDKNGKNVLFIMLDRAIGAYMPFILNERPELKEKLDGFTFYPNSLSFGWKTAIGSPALFGGYEYSPEESDKRDNMLLVEKQNEALSVMPVMFGEAGWNVTVYEPPFANYRAIADLSIYDDYPYIKAYNLEGKFNGGVETMAGLLEQRKRYFVSYSIMRAAPIFFTAEFYDGGNYMTKSSAVKDLTVSFLHYYHELQALPELTQITDDGENCFVMMSTMITHEPSLLQMPDYTPAGVVDNTGYDMTKRLDADGNILHNYSEFVEGSYSANVSTYILLGKYFDWMREQGIYDNTRIIIGADHGHPVGQIDSMVIKDGTLDVMSFNPVMLIKDYDAKGFTVSDEFMTNADAPLMALEGQGIEMVNPFTGKQMNADAKKGVLHVCGTEDLNGYNESAPYYRYQCDDKPWYSVHDNIFVEDNWGIWKEPGE